MYQKINKHFKCKYSDFLEFTNANIDDYKKDEQEYARNIGKKYLF